MRKIVCLIIVLAMCLGLVACGTSEDGASNDPNYKKQDVTYKDGFDVKCINDEIVCEDEFSGKADYLVITLDVKNIGKEDKKFAPYAHIIAKQGKETLTLGNLKNEKGKPYYNDRNKIIKPDKTLTLKYDYKLANHKDDVVVNFDSYLVGNGAGKMKFKVEGRESKEFAKYEKESKKEYESNAKIKKVDMKACKITVPKGWTIRNASKNYSSIQKDGKNQSKSISVSSPSTKISNAKAEAKKYRKNFNDKKIKIKEYKVDGKTFYGFEPTNTQFYIYGKSSNGYRVEISGMEIGYKDAKNIIDNNIKIK